MYLVRWVDEFDERRIKTFESKRDAKRYYRKLRTERKKLERIQPPKDYKTFRPRWLGGRR